MSQNNRDSLDKMKAQAGIFAKSAMMEGMSASSKLLDSMGLVNNSSLAQAISAAEASVGMFDKSSLVEAMSASSKLLDSMGLLNNSSLTQVISATEASVGMFDNSTLIEAISASSKFIDSMGPVYASNIASGLSVSASFVEDVVAFAKTKIKGVSQPYSQTIIFSTDGSITLDNQTASAYEVHQGVKDFFSLSQSSDFFDNLGELIAKYKKPIQSCILWILSHVILVVILSIFANIVTPKVQDFIKNKYPQNSREINKTLKQYPSKADLLLLSKECRIVTTNDLAVRSKPNSKSVTIDKLPCGKIVKIVKKKKNWTLIEVNLSDKEDDELIGWVYSRYLTRILK